MLQLCKSNKMGRLNIISTLGDANKDGKYEELYAFGGRSFTIWW
jgi:hypothetical protein